MTRRGSRIRGNAQDEAACQNLEGEKTENSPSSEIYTEEGALSDSKQAKEEQMTASEEDSFLPVSKTSTGVVRLYREHLSFNISLLSNVKEGLFIEMLKSSEPEKSETEEKLPNGRIRKCKPGELSSVENGVKKEDAAQKPEKSEAVRGKQVKRKKAKDKNEAAGGKKTGNEKGFWCYICKAGFGRKYDLKRHVDTHMGKASSMCSRCGKVFSRKDAAKRHADSGACVTIKDEKRTDHKPKRFSYIKKAPKK
ncbi:MAG: uncharacterized protein A8A55_1382 [Amphiamblys sp. WSBS2006]|nr:MAG: uncharacterized protein A8A55_1382 [Amphiamblys sp. WSBS2006]